MYRTSKNERGILKNAYQNYLENGTREYNLRMRNMDMMSLINALQSLAEHEFITPKSDNFYNSSAPVATTYSFELTDSGISLAESLHL